MREAADVHAHGHCQVQYLFDIGREPLVAVATGPVRIKLREPELAREDTGPIRLLLDDQGDGFFERPRRDEDAGALSLRGHDCVYRARGDDRLRAISVRPARVDGPGLREEHGALPNETPEGQREVLGQRNVLTGLQVLDG